MTGRWRPWVAAATLLALALPGPASASVTIGSDLSSTPNYDSGLGTWANGALENDLRAAGGLRSPVNGTITRWRIKVGARTAPVALRVIEPLGHGLFTGAGTDSPVVPATNTISAFATRMSISRGDVIGNDTLTDGSVTQFFGGGDPIDSRLLLWFQPSLADGDPGSTANVDAGAFVNLINADIEPSSRFVVKRVKPLRGGLLWIAIRLPNLGRLRLGDTMVPVRSPGWKTPTVATPAGSRLPITFRPIGGAPFSRTVAIASPGG
jgi:hypothetical protein